MKERKKGHKSESNGEAITFNGDLAHSEKTGKLRKKHPLKWSCALLFPLDPEQELKAVQSNKPKKSRKPKRRRRTVKERLLLDPESSRKLAACMLKTFNRMKKRVGFLLYQFVLPALQVSLFCLAIGQDPKELPVAVVNAENAGAACVSADVITECPFSLTGKCNNYRNTLTCQRRTY